MTTIYVVDDHRIVRDGLRAVLENAGHQVVGEASDITQALSEMNRLQPEVVLLDLQLEGRSGFEILAELIQRKQPTRAIVLSMSSQPRDVAQALRLGASGYVLKGSNSVVLLEAIESVARGGRYLSASLTDIAIQGLTADTEKGDALSPRELQIMVLVAKGKTSATIGAEMHLSAKTVDTYRSRLMTKLGLVNVPELVRWALREKLIELGD